MRTRVARLAFNRGLISRLGLARADIKRSALAAETMTNWMVRVLGSMMLRPGFGFLDHTLLNNRAFYLPFTFSISDKALIEVTDLVARVWVDEEVVTRAAVSSAVTNSSFSQYTTPVTITNAAPGVATYTGADNFANNDPVSFATTGVLPLPLVADTVYYVRNLNAGANTFEVSLTSGGASINTTTAGSGTHTVGAYWFMTGWTDADEAGATSTWVSTDLAGDTEALGLTGTGTAYAIRRQQVVVAAPDQNVEHAIEMRVVRGPVVLRVGSASSLDDYLSEVVLDTGYHNLAFTPTGAAFWIDLKSRLERQVLIDYCQVAGAGEMALSTPWAEADLRLLRYDQSGDVVFVACGKTTDTIGYKQRRFERRGTTSWSVVEYSPEDGPFRVENTTATTLTPSALSGNVTLTASSAVFQPEHVGALFQIVSVGQQVAASITAQNEFSDPIRISGVDASRIFTIVITGLTGTGSTVNLQRSLDEPGNWEDVATGGTGPSPWLADRTRTYDDGLDNQIVFYRIGVETGDYAGGTILVSLAIGTGSITGVVRVTDYTSATVVDVEVLTTLGSTAATDRWSEGQWSDLRGWPTSVAFHEGRLGWAGRDAVVLSISDAFDGFDPDFEGDAGPINRTIGSGPVDTINWLMSLQRLILGGQGAEFSVRSSSLDEPLTPTNFNMKRASNQGSASPQGVVIDQNGVFVQRGGVRVFEMAFGDSGIDYESTQLTALIPEIGDPGIVRMGLQRQPDTRLHCVRSDGTVCVLVFDRVEQVICWLEIETDGLIEDVVTLPGDVGDAEDFVYYQVARTIGGVTKRYLEKWAFEADCQGGAINKLADSFVQYSQAASATITGLAHLEGESVVVWDAGVCLADADGDIATFTVTGAQITVTHMGLERLATAGVVGLPYQAPWKSSKFVELMDQPGGSLLDMQRVEELGLIMADVHAKGLKYGFSLVASEMNDLPEIENGTTVDPDAVRTDYAQQPFAPPGGWSTDQRLCLLAQAPRPVTVLAAIAKVQHHG